MVCGRCYECRLVMIQHQWPTQMKLCRLVSKFGRVCKRRKLGVNEVKRYSKYGNVSRMDETLNGEPLQEVDCFNYLWLQVAVDGGCE